jgi:hypothetical protein
VDPTPVARWCASSFNGRQPPLALLFLANDAASKLPTVDMRGIDFIWQNRISSWSRQLQYRSGKKKKTKACSPMQERTAAGSVLAVARH